MTQGSTSEGRFRIKPATVDDVGLVLDFVKCLAEYERMADEVATTEDDLRESLFGPGAVAEAVIGYAGDEPVGLALFFYTYSTFTGRHSLYLEDIFVLPQWRGQGMGRELMGFLAKKALARKCRRLEWSVLDWNEPAIGFYKRLGAVPVNGWTTYRLAGAELEKLASEASPDLPG
jgi:GNAT superfamily N-acetyltransferase